MSCRLSMANSQLLLSTNCSLRTAYTRQFRGSDKIGKQGQHELERVMTYVKLNNQVNAELYITRVKLCVLSGKKTSADKLQERGALKSAHMRFLRRLCWIHLIRQWLFK